MNVDDLLSANITAESGLVAALAISRIYLIVVFLLLVVHLFIRFVAAHRGAAGRDLADQPVPDDAEEPLVR